MYFNPTATNVTAMLVIALAMVSVIMLLKKRYDSNLPLLFYFAALVFATVFDRPVSPTIMYSGLGAVLLLRFEFMSPGFAKLVAFLANTGMCLMIWIMLSEVGG